MTQPRTRVGSSSDLAEIGRLATASCETSKVGGFERDTCTHLLVADCSHNSVFGKVILAGTSAFNIINKACSAKQVGILLLAGKCCR